MNLFCPKEALNFISNQLEFNKFIVVSPILSRSFEFKSKKLNPEVAEAMKNAAQLGMSSTIFSSRNMKTLNGDLTIR